MFLMATGQNRMITELLSHKNFFEYLKEEGNIFIVNSVNAILIKQDLPDLYL